LPVGVVEKLEQPLQQVGLQGGLQRIGFPGSGLRAQVGGTFGHRGLQGNDLAAAPFLPLLPADGLEDLAARDAGQQVPQGMAIVQVGELPFQETPVEGQQGALRRVLGADHRERTRG
jgi:hypothetical protein